MYIYKNKTTGLYYIWLDADTNDISKVFIFGEYQFSKNADQEIYDRIPYEQEMKEIRKNKLQKLNDLKKIN